jgi:hypothetical protein
MSNQRQSLESHARAARHVCMVRVKRALCARARVQAARRRERDTCKCRVHERRWSHVHAATHVCGRTRVRQSHVCMVRVRAARVLVCKTLSREKGAQATQWRSRSVRLSSKHLISSLPSYRAGGCRGGRLLSRRSPQSRASQGSERAERSYSRTQADPPPGSQRGMVKMLRTM